MKALIEKIDRKIGYYKQSYNENNDIFTDSLAEQGLEDWKEIKLLVLEEQERIIKRLEDRQKELGQHYSVAPSTMQDMTERYEIFSTIAARIDGIAEAILIVKGEDGK